MVRSLGLVLVAIFAVVWFAGPDGRDEREVRVVDAGPALADAVRSARFPVLAPAGLPAQWRVTSAYFTPPAGPGTGSGTLHLGYLTPEGQYAALEQSDRELADLITAVADGARRTGDSDVAGAIWDVYGGREDTRALARRDGAAVVVVGGTASEVELRELIRTLRPLPAT